MKLLQDKKDCCTTRDKNEPLSASCLKPNIHGLLRYATML